MTRHQGQARPKGQPMGQREPRRRARLRGLLDQLPLRPLAGVFGVVVLAALIGYLIVQANAATTAPAADRAALDSSQDIPGTFVPSQGVAHLAGAFSIARTPLPFCEGVPYAGAPAGAASPTATATVTPSGTATPGPAATPTEVTCYASNPPSSGPMLNDQARADVGGGALINLPPDPYVYPPDVEIPREAIPHLLEHSGVFVGYNCPPDDTECSTAVQRMADMVNKRIDNYNDRVVMARDRDLPMGQIAMSSMTRVANYEHHALNVKDVEQFIAKNECRVDSEGIC